MKKSLSSPLLGCSLSLSQPDYLEGIIKQALFYQARAITFSLSPSQRYNLPERAKLNVPNFHKLLKKHGFNKKLIAVHASYLINLANFTNRQVYRRSVDFLKKSLEITSYMGIQKMILHPGFALENDRKMALDSIIKGLDEILGDFPQVEICLETMSGKGSELGKNFDELKYIIENSQYSPQIKVCFDTCHLFTAGYDIVNDFDGVLKLFDTKVGLNKLAVLHINDSMKPFRSFKDRHANIGKGEIGYEALRKIVHHFQIQDLPMFLETPREKGELPLFKEEIEMLIG